jgi:hypothetical protein
MDDPSLSLGVDVVDTHILALGCGCGSYTRPRDRVLVRHSVTGDGYLHRGIALEEGMDCAHCVEQYGGVRDLGVRHYGMGAAKESSC